MKIVRLLPAILVALFTNCLEPTEVKLEITTDADCKDIHGVQIAVGVLGDELERAPPSASTTQCVNGRIGRLVLVPSPKHSTDPIGVRVVAGFGNGHTVEACTPPFGKGCIVARRAIRYVAHLPLTLPITLDAACDGIPCEASYTCKAGACVPAMLPDCGTTGCDPTEPQWADCGDTSGAEKGSPWPMSDGCPAHTRRSPYAAASSPKLKWRLPMTFMQTIISLPAVSTNGSIVFGTETGLVSAYEIKTGTLRKSQTVSPMDRVGGNGGLLSNGSFVISGSAGIYGLPTDLSTGPTWSHLPLGTDVIVGPGPITYVVYNGDRTRLLGFDAQGNTPVDVDIAPSGLVFGSPSIGLDGTLYATIGDGQIYAIDPKPPGTIKWHQQVGVCDMPTVSCTSHIAASKDFVFMTAYQTIMPPNLAARAFDTAGNPKWQLSGATPSCGIVIGENQTVYVAVGGRIEALDAATSAMKWFYDFGAAPKGCMLDGSGAFLAIANGRLVAVDTTTHQKRWDVDAFQGNEIVLGGDGTIYMTTDDNTLVALGY